ncbi:MAG: hypothetical protein EOM73_01055 [Bacteroidia bacterium]|nr:hypothetical protein [Bacteroidia bacterium]
MKTLKLKLLATMIILAAMTATISATAQRRTSTVNATETRTEKNEKTRKEAVQNKTTTRSNDSRRNNSVGNKVGNSRVGQTKSASTDTDNKNKQVVQERTVQKSSGNRQNVRNRAENQPAVRNRNSDVEKDNRKYVPAKETERTRNTSVRKQESNSPTRNIGTQGKNENYRKPAQRRTTGNTAVQTQRAVPSKAREIYRHNDNDQRYIPNKNYNGSDRYWSNNYRPGNMYYNHNNSDFYRKYDYRTYNHWDRSWERYRWDLNSWRDYYSGYNPYSFRYHKHYYHHPVYGHVIRGFGYKPLIFIHNNHKYYCHNGHFFRFRRGVGYVLVDVPFGIVFERLPYGPERVYVNGYLYFRVGNLFFELSDYGYLLVHYPERYFAYNHDFRNEGYYFDDGFYY